MHLERQMPTPPRQPPMIGRAGLLIGLGMGLFVAMLVLIVDGHAAPALALGLVAVLCGAVGLLGWIWPDPTTDG